MAPQGYVSKYDLITKLKAIQKKEEEMSSASMRLSGNTNRIAQLRQEIAQPKLWDVNSVKRRMSGVVAGIIVFTIFGYIVSEYREQLDNFADSSRGATLLSLIVPLTTPIIVGIIVSHVFTKLARQKVQQENQRLYDEWENQKPKWIKEIALRESENQRLPKVIDDAARAVNTWSNQIGLHQRYRNSTALLYIISYLETGRCDTLKEALNMFEHELREDERDRAEFEHQRAVQQSMQRQEAQLAAIQQEASRQADAAEDAAASATANGIMTSLLYDEIRRNRK